MIKWKNIGLIIPLISILMLIGNVFAAGEMYYYDKAFNRDWDLTPKTDEICIKFTERLDDSDVADFTRDYGLTEIHNAMWNRYIVYRLKSGFDTYVIDQLKTDQRVVDAAVPGIDKEGFTKYFDPTEATVQFHKEYSDIDCEEIISQIGATIVRKQWTPNYYTISVAEGRNVFETLEILNEYVQVHFCEPSIYGFDDLAWEPNDPYFDEQWHLYNTGQESGVCVCSPYSSHDINIKQAWDMNRGDRGVIIVVIDTGMDLTHPDLAGNLYSRGTDDWDFADSLDSSPDDTGNHGTACCGLAAAVANNGTGVCGAAPECYLMPLRVNLSSGQNQNRADAINYARSRASDFDAMVISMSWLMSSGSYTAVQIACNYAYDYNDVLLLAASGNNDTTPVSYPSFYRSVMAVGATSPCDERISTSSCDGEYWGANYGDSLEISAPGVFMYTTDRQGTPGYSTGDYYDSFNGTSSACPTAAGVAALVRSANRDLTNAQARVILRTTCDQVGGYVYSPKSYELGYGRVNAHRAVLEAMRAGLNTSVDIDANMDGLPDDYLNSYGKENVGGYFGETYFGPHATILEHTYRDSYNYTGYPMNSWDAVLYSSDNDMITCVFNTPTDSVTIAYAASSSYGLSLEAYDSLGNLLQSVVGSGGTYRVSYLTVTSSAENIAYVVMHDHGGYFVIDDVMYAKPYGVRCFMIPTTGNPEITIAPTGGTFYFWAIIENNSSSLYNVDLETASIDPSGTYYPTNSWNNIPVGRYERQTYYASMYVPAGVVPGMWASRVTYGNFPFDTKGAYQHGLYKRSSLMQGDGEPFDISEFVVEGFLGKVAISDSRDPFVRPDIEDLQDVIPTEFALNGNYPNPFNPTTKINYQLPTTSVVSLDIYNILGQKVETLVDGEVSAGYHTVDWNASEYSSGVYFAKLSDGKKTVTHKMMLVK